MTRLLPFVWTVLYLAAAADSNRLPHDEAQAYARLCAPQAATLLDLPLSMEVDTEKPCAVRGEGGGAMIIPAKGLSADRLAKAGKEVVPLGQLWLRKWTVVASGKPVSDDRLRIVTVKVEDKDRPMPLFLLGVQPSEKGRDLVLYAANPEPLFALPLKGIEGGEEIPLVLEWKRGEQNQPDSLTLWILGKYQAELPIAAQQKAGR